jgi:hypothetical protein
MWTVDALMRARDDERDKRQKRKRPGIAPGLYFIQRSIVLFS